MSPTEFNAVNS